MKTSQNKLIRQHLQSGRKLTSLEALKLFGCLRLSGRIHNLREEGMEIKTTMVERNGKRVAEYSL